MSILDDLEKLSENNKEIEELNARVRLLQGEKPRLKSNIRDMMESAGIVDAQLYAILDAHDPLAVCIEIRKVLDDIPNKHKEKGETNDSS